MNAACYQYDEHYYECMHKAAELPMTGFAVLLIFVLGVIALSVGLYLRFRK